MGETHPTPAENTSATSRLVEGRPGSVEGDIDQRMANLLKDHQEMGARPDKEPVSDTHEATYPLKAKATDGRNVMPTSTTRAKSTKRKKSK